MAAIIAKLYAILSQRKVYMVLYYLSFIACPIAYFSLLLLPNLNERNFVSENAIKIPSMTGFSEEYGREFLASAREEFNSGKNWLEFITKVFEENKLPHRFFPNNKNFVGIYNAPRGMGQDAFLISFRYGNFSLILNLSQALSYPQKLWF